MGMSFNHPEEEDKDLYRLTLSSYVELGVRGMEMEP